MEHFQPFEPRSLALLSKNLFSLLIGLDSSRCLHYLSRMENTHTFTPAQERDLRALMGTFPFRIIYAATHPDTGEWVCSAVLNMRIPNRLARQGWSVIIVK